MDLIDRYIRKLEEIRNASNWSSLEYVGVDEEEELRRQKERYKIGVGLFNNLLIPEDYDLVSFLFDQEINLRKSKVKNQEADVLYLYAYFLSRFKKIDDVWKFVDAKYIDFDTVIGFDTNYFFTFGLIEIYHLATNTDHKKRDLLVKAIGKRREDTFYDADEFQKWEEGRVEYYDFVKPIKNSLNFYRIFDEKYLFKTEFKKWMKKIDLDDKRMSYKCIHLAKYAEDKEALITSIETYLRYDKEGFLHDKFRRELEQLRKE